MKRLLLQLVKFLGFSGIGWVLDFLVYTVLGVFSKNLLLNNIISSFLGVTFVFVFSTKTIFKNKSKIPLKVKYLIYIIYQCILIFLVSALLNYINSWILGNVNINIIVKYAPIISKIIITPITILCNFAVMKNIIEKI